MAPPPSRDIQRMFVGGQPSQVAAQSSHQQRQPEQVSQVMAKSPPRPLMNLNGQTPARPTVFVDVLRSVPATPMSLAGPPPPPAGHGQGQNRPGPAAAPVAAPMTPVLRSNAAPPSPPEDFMRRLENELEQAVDAAPIMNGGHQGEGHNGGEGKVMVKKVMVKFIVVMVVVAMKVMRLLKPMSQIMMGKMKQMTQMFVSFACRSLGTWNSRL